MQPVDFAAGNWYRAARYEVVDGSIVPAPDSEIEVYDPWAGGWPAKRIHGVAVPRYQSLLELVQKLETAPVQQAPRSRKREPLRRGNSAGEKLILTWCQKFGLLGILPTLATFVRLAPRWGPLEHLDRAGAAGLCAHQDVMIRIGGGLVEPGNPQPR